MEYSDIIVQSLQVIPGEEYSRVVAAVKDFANNSNGDLDDDYLSGVNLYIGYPLMANADDDVLQRMQEAGISTGTVYLHPLMSIAGDHAHNDMAGDTDAPTSLTENDEEVSWKTFFQTAGYTCNDETVLQYGLLELPTVRQLWMNHTADALDRGPEELYHSKYSEE